MTTLEQINTPRGARVKVRELRAGGKSVGLVPTRGILHEGHLARIQRARAECGVVVVSVFVSPLHFSDPAAYDAFPRDLARDAALAAQAGADVLYAPSADDIFPFGPAPLVTLKGPLVETLEGAAFLSSFTTELTKQLCAVLPDRLYLSEQAWQELKVAERLLAELNFPAAIVGCPAVREADGLAITRATRRLTDDERKKARVLPYLLASAQDLLDTATHESQTDQGGVLCHWLATLLQSNQPDAVLEYIAVVDPVTLEPLDEITDKALVAIALRIGEHRLTDSRILRRR